MRATNMTTDRTSPLIAARKLTVGYRGRTLLPPIDFEVTAGEQWALIGPNGAGKTTLIRTILSMIERVGGTVHTTDAIGYVPQRASIDDRVPARVVDVVALGLDHGWSFLRPGFARQRRNALASALADTNCGDLARLLYAQLSEGQKQRVLIARALASQPRLLVLDEPTASMDLRAEASVFDLLLDLRRSRGLAVLVVSHQLSLAAKYATHAIVVDKDGDFAHAGPMEDVARHPEVVDRYGKLFVRAVIDEHELSEVE